MILEADITQELVARCRPRGPAAMSGPLSAGLVDDEGSG